MQFYSKFKISKEEGEAILSIVCLAEYIDKQATASPFVREVYNCLKSSFNEIEKKIDIESPILDAANKDKRRLFIEKTIAQIQNPHLKLLVLPLAYSVTVYDNKSEAEEKNFIQELKRIINGENIENDEKKSIFHRIFPV